MVDAHVHVVPPNLPGVGPLGKILTKPAAERAEALRAQMKAAGVTSALAMGEWNAPEGDALGVRSTLEVAALTPGLKAIGVMDPCKGHDRDHIRRAEEQIRTLPVVALKGYLGYLHFAPGDAAYRPYYELAARHKLPVVFHTGDTYSPYAKLKFAHPLLVDEVAVDHPEVKFVLAHFGNPWLTDAAAVVYKNLNVWADLSGLVVGGDDVFLDEERRDMLSDLSSGVRRAFRYAERPTRFVYGSDWPLVGCAAYRQFVASLVPATFHAEVFAETARGLFKL